MIQKRTKNQLGFTIVELLVVMAIMAMIATLLIIDFNSQKVVRNLTIAKNETATNIRKVQSYMLSSRDIDGQPVKYYILTFRTGESSYTAQAVDAQYGYHDNVETFNLRQGVYIDALTLGGEKEKCVQIIFSSPFVRMYAHADPNPSACDSSIVNDLADPVQLAALSQQEILIYLTIPKGPGDSYIAVNPVTGQAISH